MKGEELAKRSVVLIPARIAFEEFGSCASAPRHGAVVCPMRLEHLEINGFKSFSDRSELAFDKGVTAIVGPNGCGKSNVADAITWVMGEQSAKSLRGDRMEDVIFSGSDARKPTASAEVRLRFSGVLKTVAGESHADRSGNGNANGHGNGNGNGHGSASGNGHEPGVLDTTEDVIRSVARQVEVTRRLYRSGESEYLIDGQVCRLRDVHELLMDTGLGAKAYAIIEQGKIGLILSSRPTDRRQLIEEAAGVTKYRARRRAAALKLEAAQQNLTRIDDIVFEVEKQRGTLKRQAGKARRHRKLRDELRRWEKVLLARKYRQLAGTIESVRLRLAEARSREAISAARLSEIESDLGRVRIELAEAESRATAAREAVHAGELAINSRQQQIAFDAEQVNTLRARAEVVSAELTALDLRREPARAAVVAQRQAAEAAAAERDRAARMLASEAEASDSAVRGIEGLEADVEAARSEVFSAINAATALRHSLEHAASARDKAAETMSRLLVEADDVRLQHERASADRQAAHEAVQRAQRVLDATQAERAARESELASARIEHEWRSRSVRSREQELAGLDARLQSFEELQAARAEYDDAARTLLGQPAGAIRHRGAIADYIEVEPGYERAVQACLGDLLQHVIVERPEDAVAGFQLLRGQRAGRCGFLVADSASADEPRQDASGGDTSRRTLPVEVAWLSSVVRVTGPFAASIRRAMGEAWITDTYERARDVCRLTGTPVATRAGDLFRGDLVSGGVREDARGILETKREINELRDRLESGRQALGQLIEETGALDSAIAHASSALAALNSEQHRQEKVIVACEAQARHAADEVQRLGQKSEQLARERRQVEEEREALDRREAEARQSIERLEQEQRLADERLTGTQRRLFEAREAVQDLSRRAADAGASHAALVERASALASEVQRLEEVAADLEGRAASLGLELEETRGRIGQLREAIAQGQALLDAEIGSLDALRREAQTADAAVSALRIQGAGQEDTIRDARTVLDTARAGVAELDIARATSEADLSHLAQSCVDTVQASLDDVLAEVVAQEEAGSLVPDASIICGDDPEDSGEDGDLRDDAGAGGDQAAARQFEQLTLSAEEAIVRLRAKIDRLGPVNMMAIEQFDELEARHTFLTTQRKDLVDSIAQTTEAIRRIDETTRQRFAEAFAAINDNFQQTFGTLFGGGRAGLTLLDENDPLESGIEIIAQPPGKRLQSVQLLSGGEKALTAIALMFALFKYKPSPFCLLDEIDAPLDDANIGRFVEMLRGMQQHTQFILITHNRKTMEIADRLYGVTMEEPGVSKLISVHLN
jgi:chromosome segregation protein